MAKKYIFCFVLLLFFVACNREKQVSELTIVAETGPFSVEVKGRCELRAKIRRYVESPRPSGRIQRGSMRLDYVIEDGTNVKKGMMVARVSMPDLPRYVRNWRSEQKVALAAFQSAQKNFVIERNKLQMAIRKLKISLREKIVALKIAQLSPGSSKRLNAQEAINEARKSLSHRLQQLNSHRYLASKKLTSDYDLKQKELLFWEGQLILKEKELDRLILLKGADPLEIKKLNAAVEKERISLQQAENDFKYKLKGLEAEVNRAKIQLYRYNRLLKDVQQFYQNCVLKAPMSGIAQLNRTWTGSGKEKVKKGMQIWGRQALLSIQNVNSMQIVVEIPERQIRLVSKGQKAVVTIDSIKGKNFYGVVEEIGNVARNKKDTDEEQDGEKETTSTKVFEVVVKLKEKDARLKPGLTGTVNIIVQKFPSVLSIPLDAIFREKEKNFVYVKHMGKIYKREISLGRRALKKVIVKKGLAAGEKIYLYMPFKNKAKKEIFPFRGKFFKKGAKSHSFAHDSEKID